ncbi:hypothetical protein [Intestinibacter bartlettii]|uniref:Uncharacterized protein n=1 Tax=Intestinibacter bartlettii TaxID=261299 RepID=A0ABS6E076_9FIRM|nr:hypothetical protein [Intestinibacter bartlettii]MBU5337509.1 hypothetical protein [Intestinibacter bartlettii]
MDNQRYIDLLEKEEIQEEICNMYCKLHRELWSNFGTSYHIILNQKGEVYNMHIVDFNTINEDILESRAIIITTIDGEAVEVSTDDMGPLEEVDDFEEFKEWIIAPAEIEMFENYSYIDLERYFYDNADWNEYKEFNLTNFQELEREAWFTNCDLYDYDYIRDKIQQKIESLEETK